MTNWNVRAAGFVNSARRLSPANRRETKTLTSDKKLSFDGGTIWVEARRRAPEARSSDRNVRLRAFGNDLHCGARYHPLAAANDDAANSEGGVKCRTSVTNC